MNKYKEDYVLEDYDKVTDDCCLAFIFFALDRKNYAAFVLSFCFTVCHLIYGVVNFCLH